MYTPESVLENQTHKILSNFEVLTDNLIPTRQSDAEEAARLVDFAVTTNQRVKKKTKIEINFWTLLENKKAVEHQGDGDTDGCWWSWNKKNWKSEEESRPS